MFVEDYPRSFRSLIIYNKRIKCNFVFANNFGKSSFFQEVSTLYNVFYVIISINIYL